MHQYNLTSSFAGLHRLHLIRLALVLLATLGVPSTYGATRTWTGGHASSANWNLRDNWGGVAVPASGDTLVFPDGAARLINTNNIAGLRLNSIQFSGAVGGYNLRGLGLVVSNGITALGAANNTIALANLTLEKSQSFSVASGGGLTVNSDLALNGFNLAIAAVGEVTMTGIISGTGNVTKTGTGTLRFSNANTYQGVTTVNAGTLRIGNDAALGATKNGTVVNDSAELFLEAAISTLREPLTLAGTGPGGSSGAIRLSSSATIATNIVLSAPTTIHTMGGGNLTIAGVISGSGPLTKIGPGTLILAGSSANTFTGDLIAEDGVLLLSKLAGSAVQGDLVIGTATSAATARHTRSANLGGAVTVNSESLYDLNGNNESIDALTLHGGGDVQTGTGQLTLNGDVVYIVNPGPFPKPSIVEGRLHVDIGERHFVVEGENEDHVVRNDLVIRAHVAGSANIVKRGSGNLGLIASNSFTGTLTVEAGDLSFGDAHSLGTSGSQTILTGNSSIRIYTGLDAGDGIIVGEPLFLNTSRQAGGGFFNYGSNVWSGSVFLGQTTVVNVTTNSTLTISGVINGLAGLTKIGDGTLIYSGTASNTYIGTTRVHEGTLRLGRTGGHNRAIPGPLIIGDGVGGDVVETVGDRPQIRSDMPVTVNSSGRLILNSMALAEAIGSLAGTGRVELNDQTLETGLDNTSTLFAGLITGSGALYKHGSGTFVLTGANTYSGTTSLQQGTLVVDGDQPSSDVYVYPSATLSGVGRVKDLLIDGTLAPGDPLGRLTADTVNFLPGSTMIHRLEGRPQTGAFTPYGNNWFQSFGAVDVTGAALDITLGFPPSAGQQFFIGTKLGAALPMGTFSGKPEGSVIMLNQIPFHLSYQGGSGNDITLTVGELALRLDRVRVEAGNGNGRIEPDECNDLFVSIENPTGAAVTVTDAHLQSFDNRIVVTQGKAVYGAVPASGIRTNRTAFQLRIAPDYPCGLNAEFHLVVTTVGHGRFAIPVTLATGSPGAFRAFPSVAGPALIPDAGTLSSPLQVATNFRIGKVRVSLHVTHPSAGQLRFRLRSPLGQEVLLAAHEGGVANDYGDSCSRRTTFDDDAVVNVTAAAAPFAGTFAPEGKLGDFVGQESVGFWTLLAEDMVAGGLGSLQCWTLELAPAVCAEGGGGCASCLTTVNGALDTGQTMPRHLLGGYPSGCGDAPDCPGTTAIWDSPYRYATHRFTNSGPDACVSVMMTVPCADPNSGLTCAAYLGDFNSGDLCANFLGHCGYDIANGSGGFSFRVPAGERFTVVVNERNIYDPFEGCDTYTLELYGLPCPQGQPTLYITNDAGPDKVRLHWSTAYPGFQLQGTPKLGVALFAFTNVANMPVVIDGNYSVTNQHSQKNNGFFRLRRP